jgi:hypothetical protein
MSNATTASIRWLAPFIAVAGAATLMVASAPGSTPEVGTAASPAGAGGVTSGDSCVDCHGDPGLRVTDPRLFDYFQKWRVSPHAAVGVSCAGCHGGDPTASEKAAAHGTGDIRSATDFRHVPETCGQCHGDMYEAYVKSHHYELLMADEKAGAGPNCVTCHGSLDAMALTVTTVDAVCGHCHTQEPSIGRRAEALLRDLDVISAYARFVRLRGSPETIEQSNRTLEPVIRNLVIEWHAFDLDAIEARTDSLLELSQIYRDRVREERRAARETEAAGAPGAR